MKVEELMLGDWVTIAECNPTQMAIGCAKIVGIDRKTSIEPYTIGFEYSFYDDKGKECIALNSCSIDRLRPIPLTEEILDKNGFNVKNTTALLEIASGRVLINTIRLPEYGEADVKATGYNTERYCGMFVRIEKTIKYVHELQHALRICGIEKEVVL